MAQRFGFGLLVAAALALLVLGKTHGDAVRQLRVLAVEAIAPVLEVLSAPVISARHALSEIEYFWQTNRENQALREQVTRLAKW